MPFVTIVVRNNVTIHQIFLMAMQLGLCNKTVVRFIFAAIDEVGLMARHRAQRKVGQGLKTNPRFRQDRQQLIDCTFIPIIMTRLGPKIVLLYGVSILHAVANALGGRTKEQATNVAFGKKVTIHNST